MAGGMVTRGPVLSKQPGWHHSASRCFLVVVVFSRTRCCCVPTQPCRAPSPGRLPLAQFNVQPGVGRPGPRRAPRPDGGGLSRLLRTASAVLVCRDVMSPLVCVRQQRTGLESGIRDESLASPELPITRYILRCPIRRKFKLCWAGCRLAIGNLIMKSKEISRFLSTQNKPQRPPPDIKHRNGCDCL